MWIQMVWSLLCCLSWPWTHSNPQASASRTTTMTGPNSASVLKSAAQSWCAGSLFRVCFKSSILLSCFPFPLSLTFFILHYHCLCKRKLRSGRCKCFLTFKRSHLRWRPLKLTALSVCLITRCLGSAHLTLSRLNVLSLASGWVKSSNANLTYKEAAGLSRHLWPCRKWKQSAGVDALSYAPRITQSEVEMFESTVCLQDMFIKCVDWLDSSSMTFCVSTGLWQLGLSKYKGHVLCLSEI